MKVSAGGGWDWRLIIDSGKDVKETIEMWRGGGVGYIANVTLVFA